VFISSSEGAGLGTDTVRFKDLNLTDIVFDTWDYTEGGTVTTNHGVAIRFTWSNSSDTGELRIANMGDHIERFEFADGTVVDQFELDSDGRVIFTGTSGNDTFSGTAGVDILTGGAGNDTFDFTALNSQIPQSTPADIVTDFVAGAGTDDVLELSSSHFSSFDDVLALATENVSEGSVTLHVGLDAPLVVLEGVALADLHQDDFRFV